MIKFVKKVKYIIAETVRTCCNGQNFYIISFYYWHKQITQIVNICICIGERLKISNIFTARIFIRYYFFCFVNIINGKISGTMATAEYTASCTESSISVRTGHVSGKT